MDEQITLSKLDAAKRQLRMAIRLLFEGTDPVPVHTLIGAASIILSDLVEKEAPERSWDRFAQDANNITAPEYFRIMRKAQNYLKHAKDDPYSILDFNPIDTENLAFWAVMNSGELGNLSMEESVYQLWFLACHDEGLEDDQPPFKDALALFGDLRNLDRAKRLRKGYEVLQEQLNIVG